MENKIDSQYKVHHTLKILIFILYFNTVFLILFFFSSLLLFYAILNSCKTIILIVVFSRNKVLNWVNFKKKLCKNSFFINVYLIMCFHVSNKKDTWMKFLNLHSQVKIRNLGTMDGDLRRQFELNFLKSVLKRLDSYDLIF